jgi:hypothetical protein
MEEQVVDLAPFLAAVVQEAGGEIIVNLSTLAGLDADQIALAIDPTEDEQSLSIRLVPAADVPSE